MSYTVLFWCISNPGAGWHGKGQYPTREIAEQWANLIQSGTRGIAKVLDPWGREVYSVG